MRQRPMQSAPASSTGFGWTRRAARVFAGALLFLGACGKPPEDYPIVTPDDTVTSIRRMIENGDAHRLGEVVLIEGERERALFTRVGRLLDACTALAKDARRAFPEDIERIEAELLEARASGKDETIFGKLSSGEIFRDLGINPMTGTSSAGRGQGRQDFGPLSTSGIGGMSRDELKAYMLQLLAVPETWIEQGKESVSVVLASDKQAAVLWNGRPIIPFLGLIIEYVEPSDGSGATDEGWYLVPPSRAPFAQQIAPKTDVQFQIAEEGIRAMEGVVQTLTERVRSGQITSADQLAEEALDGVWLPVGGVAVAYFSAKSAAADARPQPEAQGTPESSSP